MTLPISIPNFTSSDLQQFQDVDQVIVQSVSAGDPLIATNYAINLWRAAEMKGLALARLLYGLRYNWDIFQAAGIDDDFAPFVEAQTGFSRQTILKYSEMWKNIFLSDWVDEDVKKQLQFKPVQQLLLLNAAVEEGSITNEELRTVAVSDLQTTREIIQKARGKESTSKNAITLFVVKSDNNPRHPRGTIYAMKDGMSETIGFLNLDLDEDFAQKAMARIINSVGMMEK